MTLRFLVVALCVGACSDEPSRGGGADSPGSSPGVFVPTVRYDTVVVAGGPEETNPLFLYVQARATLVSDSLVAYADRGGRMVVANLITGEGWEISSALGEAGPGELDGQSPMLFSYAGQVHAVISDNTGPPHLDA